MIVCGQAIDAYGLAPHLYTLNGPAAQDIMKRLHALLAVAHREAKVNLHINFSTSRRCRRVKTAPKGQKSSKKAHF